MESGEQSGSESESETVTVEKKLSADLRWPSKLTSRITLQPAFWLLAELISNLAKLLFKMLKIPAADLLKSVILRCKTVIYKVSEGSLSMSGPFPNICCMRVNVWPKCRRLSSLSFTFYESCAHLISGPRISGLNHHPRRHEGKFLNMSDRIWELGRGRHSCGSHILPSCPFQASPCVISCRTVRLPPLLMSSGHTTHQPTLLSLSVLSRKEGEGGVWWEIWFDLCCNEPHFLF